MESENLGNSDVTASVALALPLAGVSAAEGLMLAILGVCRGLGTGAIGGALVTRNLVTLPRNERPDW